MIRRTIMSAVVTLLALGAGATAATAVPADAPGQATVQRDLFPGAKPGGERTGPLATSRLAAGAAGGGAGGLVGDPFTGFTCDGTSGPRVEVLYVREASMPERYTSLQPILQTWLLNADAAFNDGAARTGQSRHIRYLTEFVNGSCQAVIRNVVVPAGSLSTFDSGITAVQNAGYTSNARKYIMLTESNVECGRANIHNDDSAGSANLHNTVVRYARVDAIAGCFGANAIAHEFAHSIGAVQLSAPHADGGWHCSERFDMMCYGAPSTFACVEWNAERLPDCNGDDYFNTSPPSGSYLATHWNLANSVFFRAGTTVDNANYPKPGFTYTVQNVASGKALDIDTASASTDLLRYLNAVTPSSAASQRWLLGYQTGMQIHNNATHLCVDTAYSGMTPGTQTLQYTCNGQDGMRWGYLPHADGSYSVMNWRNGLALTQPNSSSALVDQQVYTGAANQRWFFTKVSDPTPVVSGNNYTLTDLKGLSNVASPSGAVVGTTITYAPRAVVTTQQWKLTAVGSYWQLKNIAGNLCASNNQTTAAALTLRTCSTTLTGQQWTLRRVADGRYMLVNRYSGLALTVPDPSGGTSALQQSLNVDDRGQVFAFKLA